MVGKKYNGKTRTGVLAAAEVSDYSEGKVIRHENTFSKKVQERIELSKKTGYCFGPVFVLTKALISNVLNEIKEKHEPEYEFTSDFNNYSSLHGIRNRIFRIKENSEDGLTIKNLIRGSKLLIFFFSPLKEFRRALPRCVFSPSAMAAEFGVSIERGMFNFS